MIFHLSIIFVFDISKIKFINLKEKKLVFSCFLANYTPIFVLES